MTTAERKSNLIISLIDKSLNTVIPKRIGHFKIGDTIIANNGWGGKIAAFGIINNSVFAWIEINMGMKKCLHHGIRLSDIEISY